MFNRHDIFQLFPTKMEFTILVMITCHSKFYLDIFLLFLLFYQSWYFDWKFGIVHFINGPFTNNIIQQSLMFHLQVFRSWIFYFFENILKHLFHLILIGQTTPYNVLVQYVNPSLHGIHSKTNINNRNDI